MILLDGSAHPVIGHRGNRAFAPENTLQSFAEAVALGADALEFDVHLSRDGVLMVAHDATLQRCTDGEGALADFTAAELGRLDAGFHFSRDDGQSRPWRGRGVRLPTFDSVIESLPRELPCVVELKVGHAAPALCAAIRRHGIAQRLIVAAFDAAATRELHGAGIALGASTADVIKLLPRALLGRAAAPAPFQALCIPPIWHGVPVPIAALARALRQRDGVTHIWTVNDEAQALRLWRLGVHGIISDDPARMLRARASLAAETIAASTLHTDDS